MRIGISAITLSTAANHHNAGMSRYCFGLIETLMGMPDPHEYFVFTMPDVELPESWKQDSRFHFPAAAGPRKNNRTITELIGGSQQIKRFGLEAYLSTALALPIRCPIPSALVVHDLFPVTHPEFFTARTAKLLATLNRWAMNKADLILANSHHTKEEIHRFYGYPDEKVRVIHLALGNLQPSVDRELVTAEDLQRIGVPFDRYVFTIGTLEPRKNLPRLIEAFALAAANHPDLGLAIAGAKGWKESGLWEKVEALGLQDRVKFLGYVPDEDVPKLFARSEYFVFPSTIEGFGIPALEALHFGTPLACSNTGALPEVAGEDAVLFDPHSVDSIEDGLRRALARSGERSELVERGRRFASKFSWEATARQTLDAVVGLASK